MATLKEKILEAAVKVARCRDELGKAEKEYEELFKQTARKTVKNQPENSENVNADGIKKSILDYLARKSDGVDFNQMANDIGEKSTTVRAMLYALQDEAKVQKIGRGVWQKRDNS